MKITVDDQIIEVDDGYTILQACKIAGIEVPHFCYHDKLKIAGNCRMCLVEVEKGPPKPVASCATTATDGMVIKTSSPMVKKAREDVMEMLLINHPLDCPICDQGGECDLQDQALSYGRKCSEFTEEKRAVSGKNFGVLIKDMMNRCIHCTRCVRFMSDIAGTNELKLIHRGEKAEIESLFSEPIKSELSGNIIDVCPVGALTSRPYAFTARPWELKKFYSIDVMDGVGSSVRLDVKEQKVMRVLPVRNDAVNEMWLSDKSRFSYDGLYLQRLGSPYVRSNKSLISTDWDEAIKRVAKEIQQTPKDKIAFIAGNMTDCETLCAAKILADELEIKNIDFREKGEQYKVLDRSYYLCNTPLVDMEKADVILIIGCNPRLEAPIMNIRIRKCFTDNNAKIGYIGPEIDLNYKYDHLGDSLSDISDLISKKSSFSKVLIKAKNPMLIFGQDLFLYEESEVIQEKMIKIASLYNMVTDEWNGYNMLHKNASSVGALDLGFHSENNPVRDSKNIELVLLLGSDEIDQSFLKNKFVIYVGHHGDKGANAADVILPSKAYTEKNATFVNIEGRVQNTCKSSFGPNDTKDDWQIIHLIGKALKVNLKMDNLASLQKKLSSYGEQFKKINQLIKNDWDHKFASSVKPSVLSKTKIMLDDKSFYRTNVIARSSKIMAKCLEQSLKNAN
ncbi:NADH-quinone oxidoreductase subunit G [Anaplasmataceae bacterium AB001_6]|nr:NADH-quinone oxidoreductase subunit G [Anaplasmataceae bacterium AB001_6]